MMPRKRKPHEYNTGDVYSFGTAGRTWLDPAWTNLCLECPTALLPPISLAPCCHLAFGASVPPRRRCAIRKHNDPPQRVCRSKGRPTSPRRNRPRGSCAAPKPAKEGAHHDCCKGRYPAHWGTEVSEIGAPIGTREGSTSVIKGITVFGLGAPIGLHKRNCDDNVMVADAKRSQTSGRSGLFQTMRRPHRFIKPLGNAIDARFDRGSIARQSETVTTYG